MYSSVIMMTNTCKSVIHCVHRTWNSLFLYSFIISTCGTEPLLALVITTGQGFNHQPCSTTLNNISTENHLIKGRCFTKLQRRSIWFCRQSIWGWLPWEGVPGVVHDAIKIIWLPKRVDLPWLHLEKVILLAWGPHMVTYKFTYICPHATDSIISFIIHLQTEYNHLVCYHNHSNSHRLFTIYTKHGYGILRAFIKILKIY